MSTDYDYSGKRAGFAQFFELNLSNRDGGLFAAKADDGQCYLILQAETCWNEEVFLGLGSTEHRKISETAFLALTSDLPINPSHEH